MMHLIEPSHPSYGCSHAHFLFTTNGPTQKFILVESNSIESVELLEWLFIHGCFGSVSLVMVCRGNNQIGLRSDAIIQIPYVDFILDFVKPEYLQCDVIINFFPKSLTLDEKIYARSKIDNIANLPVSPAEDQSDKNEIISSRVKSALESLGFDKPQVSKYVQSIQGKLDQSVENLIKSGILYFTRSK